MGHVVSMVEMRNLDIWVEKPERMMRFESLTEVKVSMLVLWIITPCGFVGRYQLLGRIYCLHFQPLS
jgi:hypothetical protein